MELDPKSAEWLDTAVSGIRFGPDRRAVKRELREHMEDKAAGLLSVFPDMSEEEARERALGSMGDPRELRGQLAKVHRPWLGWLWTVSRVLLSCGIAMCLGNLLYRVPDSWYEPNSPSDDGYILELAPDSREVQLDGYIISMVEVKEDPGLEGVRGLALDVRLRMESPCFWALNGNGLCEQMEAEDSLGNRYIFIWEEFSREEVSDPFRCVSGDTDGRGPFHRNYVLRVLNVHPEAEWVRLEYDWLGRSFSMTVELMEGER